MIFNIVFTPQFRNEITVFSKYGSKFIINGNEYDFGPIPHGATLPASAIDSDLFLSDVSSNEVGEVSFKVIYSCMQDSEEFTLTVSNDGVIEDDRLVASTDVGTEAVRAD